MDSIDQVQDLQHIYDQPADEQCQNLGNHDCSGPARWVVYGTTACNSTHSHRIQFCDRTKTLADRMFLTGAPCLCGRSPIDGHLTINAL